MKRTVDDSEILNGLKQGGATEKTMLRQVYLLYRPVISDYVRRNNGTSEEAKDVFQDAVIAFYENVKYERFKGESAISSYIYSIARFIWLNKLKRKETASRILEKQTMPLKTDNFINRFFEKDQEEQVLKIFKRLGIDCQKVLVLNIYRQYNMKDLTAAMKYKNEQVARNKKYKCLKKLKAMIVEKPEMLEILVISD